MQNVMHIALNAGHTAQIDGWTMQNDSCTTHNVGRNTHNVYQGPKGGALGAPRVPGNPPYPYTWKNFSV